MSPTGPLGWHKIGQHLPPPRQHQKRKNKRLPGMLHSINTSFGVPLSCVSSTIEILFIDISDYELGKASLFCRHSLQRTPFIHTGLCFLFSFTLLTLLYLLAIIVPLHPSWRYRRIDRLGFPTTLTITGMRGAGGRRQPAAAKLPCNAYEYDIPSFPMPQGCT